MKVTTAKKIRLGCEIALSLISVALAVVFITQVADIYYSAPDGADVYSRAIVWARLKNLIAPIVLWLVAVIGCFVLSVIFPSDKASAAAFTPFDRVKRLKGKLPVSGSEDYNEKRKEHVMRYDLPRYIAYGAASAFAVAVAIYAIVYLANKNNFSSGVINTDVLALVRNVFPWLIASLLLFVAAVVYETVSAKHALKSATGLLVMAKGMPLNRSPLAEKMDNIKAAIENNSERIVLGVRIAVFIVAVVFIGLGISNGGATDVFYKAVNICTECIGLG